MGSNPTATIGYGVILPEELPERFDEEGDEVDIIDALYYGEGVELGMCGSYDGGGVWILVARKLGLGNLVWK